MRQWASKVIKFSSQYNNSSWSAEQILGPPKVYPQYGDIQGAWASASIDSLQFIELEYEKAVLPESINIYETYNAGATVAVKVMNPFNQWEVLWSTTAVENIKSSRIFSPPLREVKFATNKVRLEVNCTVAASWCEIDAVEFIGQEKAGLILDDKSYTDAMRSIVNNPTYSDVKLVLNNETAYAHKSILAARSTFFSKQFEQYTTDLIELNLSISYDELLAILSFIYTNQLPPDISTDTLITLCEVSSTLDIPSMKQYAVHRLFSLLTYENVVGIYLRVQDQKAFEEIKDYCLKYMAAHLKEMANVANFETLSQSVLVKVVQEATSMISLGDGL
ncbi:BTB/POZ domain-containing protein 19 [Biomphalaria glabrata]|nr:BTB/POZ domain-containing protein 19 [Biomphalaria glabrata]